MKTIFDKYPAYQPITRLPAPNFFAPPKTDEELTPQERLLAAGWGYVTIEPNSIQADNGAGLTRGIIGLVNKGQPRKPMIGVHYGHGHGVLHEDWIIWKQIHWLMQRKLALKVYHVMVKQHWLHWHLNPVLQLD